MRISPASGQTPGSCFSSKPANSASDFVAKVIDDESSEKYTEFPDTSSGVSLDIVDDRVMNAVEEKALTKL